MRRAFLAVLFIGIILALLASRASAREPTGVNACDDIHGQSTIVPMAGAPLDFSDAGFFMADPSEEGFPSGAYEGCVNVHENHLSARQPYFSGVRRAPNDDGFWYLEGFVWNPQLGWFLLDWAEMCGDACDTSVQQQTKVDENGFFHGYAWSDNAGWLWFDWTIGGTAPSDEYRARISLDTDCDGAPLGLDDPLPFCGYAWSDRIGWMNLEGLSIDWTPGEELGCPPIGVPDGLDVVCMDPEDYCPDGAYLVLEDEQLVCLDIAECPEPDENGFCPAWSCDVFPNLAECGDPGECQSGVIIENTEEDLEDFCVEPPLEPEVAVSCAVSVSPDPYGVERAEPFTPDGEPVFSAAPIADGQEAYAVYVEFFDEDGTLIDPGDDVSIFGLHAISPPSDGAWLPVHLDQLANTENAVMIDDFTCNDPDVGVCTAYVSSLAPTSSMNGEDRNGDGLALDDESYDDPDHQHRLFIAQPTVVVDGETWDCNYGDWPVDGLELHFQPAAEIVSLFSFNPNASDDSSPYIVAQRGSQHTFSILGKSWNRRIIPEDNVFASLRLAANNPFWFRFTSDRSPPPPPPSDGGSGPEPAPLPTDNPSTDFSNSRGFRHFREPANSEFREREQNLIIDLDPASTAERNVHQWVTTLNTLHATDDSATTFTALPTLQGTAPAAGRVSGISLTTRIAYNVNDGGIIKHVAYHSSFLPRTFNEVVSPELQARGVISSQTGVFNVQEQSSLTSLGDVATNPVRNTVVRNVAGWTKGFTLQQGQSSEVTVSDEGEFDMLVGTTGCSAITPQTIGTDRIFYFRGCDVTIKDIPEDAAWRARPVIIVEGGNLFIESNIGKEPLPSFVVLKDLALSAQDLQGNIYIHADVTDLYANMYADGSVLSYEDHNDYVSGTGWDSTLSTAPHIPQIDQRTTALRNQLYIRGSLSSRNSIGGADRNPPIGCFGERDDDPAFRRKVAIPCDLNFLRSFRLSLRRYNSQPVDLQCSEIYGNEACPTDPDARVDTDPANAACVLNHDTITLSNIDRDFSCTQTNWDTSQYGDLEVGANVQVSQGLLLQEQLINSPVVIHFVPPASNSIFRAAQPSSGGKLTR